MNLARGTALGSRERVSYANKIALSSSAPDQTLLWTTSLDLA
ncbi:hypothetical protein [Streptomyces sp. NPDC047079]